MEDVLVKWNVGLLWLKLHSTRRGLFYWHIGLKVEEETSKMLHLSDSDICCTFTDVKEFDSWEGHENCHQYCVQICSGVHLPRMLWSGLRNMSQGVEVWSWKLSSVKQWGRIVSVHVLVTSVTSSLFPANADVKNVWNVISTYTFIHNVRVNSWYTKTETDANIELVSCLMICYNPLVLENGPTCVMKYQNKNIVFSLLAVWSWKSVSVSVVWSRASLQNADFKQKPNRQKKFSVHFSLITPSDITENVWYGNGMLEGSMNLMVNFRSTGLGKSVCYLKH